MAKRDTVAAIKAANTVELDETAYKQAELDQLLAFAQAGKQTEFDALRKQFDDDGTPPDDNEQDPGGSEHTPSPEEAMEDGPTKKVKIGPKASEGAGFIHPTSKTVVTGDKVVSVPADDWTDQMLRDKFLTEGK